MEVPTVLKLESKIWKAQTVDELLKISVHIPDIDEQYPTFLRRLIAMRWNDVKETV